MNRYQAVTVAALIGCGWIAGPAWAAGYLTPETTPVTLQVLPPPPAASSGVQADDRAAYAATRKLKDSPRWTMASNDAVISADAGLRDFACALGVKLEPGTAPMLTNLLGRTLNDIRMVVDPPKNHYARHRPYLDVRGNICVERSDLLDNTASYPSGHSTLGWAWALILTELAPDRSTEILNRGRVYGESRVVCGVHYPSDIEAGRTNGAALVAALHGSAEFRSDMDAARAEVAAARKAGAPGPDPAQCRLEADTAAHRPW